MSGSENRRKLWAERESKGKCIYCGQKRATKGLKGCKDCRKKKSDATCRFVKNNPEKQKEYALRIKKEVLNKYGGKCTCCSEDRWPFLVIDHINNDGNKERRELYGSQSGASKSFYLKLRREEIRIDLQVLCWSCNSAKALYGCCPHSQQWVEPTGDQNVKC